MKKVLLQLDGYVADIKYYTAPRITKKQVDEYLHRNTGDTDNSQHVLRAEVDSVRLIVSDERAKQEAFVTLRRKDIDALNDKFNELDAEAAKETISLDQYANEFYK